MLTPELACTDVLRANETDAPQGLQDGLAKSNRLQDMTRKHMKAGLAGDTILAHIREEMRQQDLDGLIYSHPIGDYGQLAVSLTIHLSFSNFCTDSIMLGLLQDTPQGEATTNLLALRAFL